MKAEERKELETNVLADRMGKIVQKVKSGPSRRSVVWLLVVGAAVIGVILYIRNRRLIETEKAEGWVYLGLSRMSSAGEQQVAAFRHVLENEKFKEETSGLAARVELTWLQAQAAMMEFYSNPVQSLKKLRESADLFDALKTRCKDDHSLHPECMYHLAVIQEYRAVLDEIDLSDAKVRAPNVVEMLGGVPSSKYLDQAKTLYEAIVASYKDSGYGKMASDRLEAFKSDERRNKVIELNQSLAGRLLAPGRRELSLDIERFEREASKGPRVPVDE